MSRVMLTVIVVLALVVIAATVWAVGLRSSGNPSQASQTPGSSASSKASHSATTSPKAGGVVLAPVSDSTFNILGSPPGNTEDPSTAGNAIDGNPKSAWSTSFYIGSPEFGGLKKGTGLLIDMGKQVRLSQVDVLFGSHGSTTAEIYLGNSKDMSKTALGNFTLVSPSASASGNHVYKATSTATGRYVLIWLTNLPPMVNPPAQPGGKKYQALIYNVTVRGSHVSGSS